MKQKLLYQKPEMAVDEILTAGLIASSLNTVTHESITESEDYQW